MATITLKEFIAKHDGKYVDIDGAYGAQCKDLFSAYNKECVGNPTYVYGDAWKVLDAAPASFYTKMLNDGKSKMQAGDVVVWRQSFGGFGHIGMCVETDGSTTAKVFNQNYPKVTKLDANGKVITPGSPPNISTFKIDSSIAGWLRPKNFATIIGMECKLSDIQVDGMPADQRIAALKDQVKRYKEEITARDTTIGQKNEEIAGLKDTVTERDRILDEKRARIEELEAQLENPTPPSEPTDEQVKTIVRARLTTKIYAIVDWLWS